MKNEGSNIITHNYDAIDKYIKELEKRESLITQRIQIKNKKASIKNLMNNSLRKIMLLLGLGIFAVLFSYAIRLVIYSN